MQVNSNPKPRADYIDKHVGNKIKDIRILRGLSQDYIAEKLGISFQQIQKYETGQNRLSASRVYALSKILNVKLDEFFIGVDDKKAKLSEPNNFEILDLQSAAILTEFKKIKNKKLRRDIICLLVKEQ